MLGVLRRHSRHWLIMVIITIVIIGMAFFFGSSFREGGGQSWAAKVGGDVIRMRDFITRYRNVVESYRQKLGPNFDSKILESLNIKFQILTSMVESKIIAKEAVLNGLGISNVELKDSIASTPYFQKDGKFSMDYYRGMLAYNKLTPHAFEELKREDILRAKLRDLVVSSAKVSDDELVVAFKMENERVELDYVRVDPDKGKVDVSSVEISSFLATQSGTKEVKDYYTRNNDEFEIEEGIRARHILIKTGSEVRREEKIKKKEKLEELLVFLTTDNFAKMAREHSEDTESAKLGGDLGFFNRGKMVKQFEDVAFSLKEGEISNVFETRFGFHVILIEAKKPSSIIAFEDAKVGIAKGIIRERKTKRLFNKKLAEILRFKKLSNAKSTTGLFSRKAYAIPKIPASSTNDVLWAFGLERKRLHKRDIGGRIYVFSVKKHVGSKLQKGSPAFNEFKERYISDRGNLEFITYIEGAKRRWSNKIVYSPVLLRGMRRR